MQAVMLAGAAAGTEHGRATRRHGRVHQMSSRRKHNSQHHQPLLILTYHSLASHLQQCHQREPQAQAQELFGTWLKAAAPGWDVLMP